MRIVGVVNTTRWLCQPTQRCIMDYNIEIIKKIQLRMNDNDHRRCQWRVLRGDNECLTLSHHSHQLSHIECLTMQRKWWELYMGIPPHNNKPISHQEQWESMHHLGISFNTIDWLHAHSDLVVNFLVISEYQGGFGVIYIIWRSSHKCGHKNKYNIIKKLIL